MRFAPGGRAADQLGGLADGLEWRCQLAFDLDVVLLMDGDAREEGLVESTAELIGSAAIGLVAVLRQHERERQVRFDVRHLSREPIQSLRDCGELSVDRVLLLGIKIYGHNAIEVAVEQLAAAIAESGALGGELRPETLLPFSLVRHFGAERCFELLAQVWVERDRLVQLDDTALDQRDG